jgi:hypothetical protein
MRQQPPVKQQAQAACIAQQRAQHGLLAALTAGALNASSTVLGSNGMLNSSNDSSSRIYLDLALTKQIAVQLGGCSPPAAAALVAVGFMQHVHCPTQQQHIADCVAYCAR